MLRIRFFGTPVVTLSDQPLTPLTHSSILTNLFAFLVTYRHRPHSRSVLAAMFWPDIPESKAHHNLSNHLWRLRQLLEPSAGHPMYFLDDRQTLQFDPAAPFWLDVAEFEATTAVISHLAQAGGALTPETVNRLEYAVELYRAEFLEGVYADWCLGLREQLREQYLLALETLAQAHRAGGRLETALYTAQRLAQADPWREEAHFQLVQLYAQLGRSHESRDQCRRYETIWRDELKSVPSARMQALIYQVDPEGHAPADEALTRDVQPLDGLIAVLRDSPEVLTSAEQQRHREQLWHQVAELGERVGRALKARYANAEALRYLSLAAEALASLPVSRGRLERELDIRRACDEVCDLLADRSQQAENLRRAVELAETLGDPTIRAEMLARRGWLAMEQGDSPRAIALLQEMLRLCQAEAEAGGRQTALAHRLLGIAYDRWNDVPSALQHHTQALALDEALGDRPGLCTDLNNIANDLILMGNYPAALQHLERAVALTTPETPSLVRALIAGNFGCAWLALGQVATADKRLQEAMNLARQVGDREAECWLGAQRAMLYQRRGEIDRALLLAHHYYQRAVEIEAPQRITELAERLAGLYVEGREGHHALRWADRAAEVAHMHGLRRRQLRGDIRRAQAYLLLEQPTQAFEGAQEAVSTFERLGCSLEEEAELFWIYAQCARAVGNETLAASAYHRAQTALSTTADLISDVKLREGFLKHHPMQMNLSLGSLLRPLTEDKTPPYKSVAGSSAAAERSATPAYEPA